MKNIKGEISEILTALSLDISDVMDNTEKLKFPRERKSDLISAAKQKIFKLLDQIKNTI